MELSVGRRGFLKLVGFAVIASQVPINLAIKAKEKAQRMLTFQEMLKEHLPVELMREELLKRDHFLSRILKDENWSSGHLPVPFSIEKSGES